MPCIGIYILPEAQAAVENEMLLYEYIAGFMEDGALLQPLPEIVEEVRNCFGPHLNLIYFDPQLDEEIDEPCTFFQIRVVNDSFFYSKGIH
jgi:hypothetical protein